MLPLPAVLLLAVASAGVQSELAKPNLNAATSTTATTTCQAAMPDFPRTAKPCRPNGIERPDEPACVQAGCCFNVDDPLTPVCFYPPPAQPAQLLLSHITADEMAVSWGHLVTEAQASSVSPDLRSRVR